MPGESEQLLRCGFYPQPLETGKVLQEREGRRCGRGAEAATPGVQPEGSSQGWEEEEEEEDAGGAEKHWKARAPLEPLGFPWGLAQDLEKILNPFRVRDDF